MQEKGHILQDEVGGNSPEYSGSNCTINSSARFMDLPKITHERLCWNIITCLWMMEHGKAFKLLKGRMCVSMLPLTGQLRICSSNMLMTSVVANLKKSQTEQETWFS